ncbi:MAG: AI-2E family transporter [Edaphobacter sp.]
MANLTEARTKVNGADRVLLTCLLVLAVLYFGREVFIPLALAGLLAFLLVPVAAILEKWGIGRTPSTLLVILFSAVGAAALGWVMLGQIYNLAVELPQYRDNVTEKIDALHLTRAGKLSRTVDMLSSISKQISNEGASTPPALSVTAPLRSNRHIRDKSAVDRPPVFDNAKGQPISVRVDPPDESMLAVAENSILPLIHPMTTSFIVVVFLVFILLGREDLRDRGLRLAGSEQLHATTLAISDASRRVSKYLQMQLVTNLCYGSVIGVGLWLIGVPHPFLWAALTCILRFVPYVGILLAAVGPLLLSIAASPNWKELMWTAGMFFVLEVIAANFVEPMLYGISTGMSAIAILIAAIFWTLLWGFPGLLLSTPLTVCLIVIGRQVPNLRYLEVLFGEEASPRTSDRFYQRLLASNIGEARAVLVELLNTKSREEAFDLALVPALAMIEQARHSEQMTGARAEELLQGLEEVAEEVVNTTAIASDSVLALQKTRVTCVAARDYADEVACQLAGHVLADFAPVSLSLADCSTTDLLKSLEDSQPNVICVIGVPPHAVRHIRMRCHQIRDRLPRAVIVACALGHEGELSSLRSRIPLDDAQHVVGSLQLMKNYLMSLLDHHDTEMIAEQSETDQEQKAAVENANTRNSGRKLVEFFDETEEDVFTRLVTDLARSLEAPMALITVSNGERCHWEAQCGLGEELSAALGSDLDISVCCKPVFNEPTLVVPDVEAAQPFSDDQFLKSRGIRFYAAAPLRSHNGEVVGSVCVLDTRPRELSENQKGLLTAFADTVMTAIELQGTHESHTVNEDQMPDALTSAERSSLPSQLKAAQSQCVPNDRDRA